MRGAKNHCVLEHAGLLPVSFCFTLAVCGTVTRGEVTVGFGDGAWERTGLQTVSSCWGCTIWSIEPRVSVRRGKCAQAKWTYSTWRAYRSVFTCLLSQVVQTGRLPFHSDSGQYADWFFVLFFYRARRVNGANTGKCSQSSYICSGCFCNYAKWI